MRNKKDKQKAFTLIELIVVITILAILGTISFIAFQGYSAKSRDSVRTSDVSNMKKALELYSVEAGSYPIPQDGTAKDISSEEVWTEGKFDDKMLTQVGKLQKLPVDPLEKTEYSYSKAKAQNEYQIKYDLENTTAFLNPVFAEEETKTIKLAGNYNEVFVISSAGKYYAAPSLFTEGAIADHKFYITDKNEPITFDPIVLAPEKPASDDSAKLQEFATNVKNAYKDNNDLKNLPQYKAILDYADSDNAELGELILGGVVSGSSSTSSTPPTPSYSCTGSLVTANATITNNTNLTSDTPYQNTDSGASCYYECKNENYSGTNCETYSLITDTQCTGAGWIWVPDTNDVKIGTQEKSGFCISPRIGDWNSDANDGTGGISWNGWGSDTITYYQGWNTTNVDDSGNNNSLYGQTRDLEHVVDENTLYVCKPLGSGSTDVDGTLGDTIAGRMKWLANAGNSYTEAQSIDWILDSSTNNPLVGGSYNGGNKHAIPSLYIADCIDGVKDLGTDMTYIKPDNSTDEVTYAEYNTDKTTLDQSGTYPGCNVTSTDTADLDCVIYQNRQKYLTAWTQKSGSHLPSAFSYIEDGTAGGELETSSTTNWDKYENDSAKGEYQMACELYQNIPPATTENDFYNVGASSSDDVDNERIWLSAVGTTGGSDWGPTARIVGGNGCSDQHYTGTGIRTGNLSARFVVRP